ncbi:MAG TPA: chloride channel protein, partial [Methanomassiliicoccaceae archaeon]|nr:chloride channel protein [Methanomassiliicoccaceae archaeon]
MDDRAAGNEIDIRSRKFYKLLLLSGAMGAAGALLTLAFIIVLRSGIQLIWYLVPQQLGVPDGTALPLFVIGTCVAGGALVGLITRYSHARPTLLAEELGEFADCGRLDIRNGAASLLRGLVGLMFGGSIGPEGPLTGGSGALGTWLAERLKYSRPVVAVSSLSGMSGMFGSFLGSPFGFAMFTIEAGLEEGKLSWKLLLPSVVAASVGYGVFFALTGYVFGGDYDLPPYGEWYLIDLVYALPLGLLGGLLGLLFIRLFQPMHRWADRWRSRPISTAVLAGLILGVTGAVFPILLFSGDNEIQTLIDGASAMGAPLLIALALLKVFVTVVCLSLGWSGGYIFPSFFMRSNKDLNSRPP